MAQEGAVHGSGAAACWCMRRVYTLYTSLSSTASTGQQSNDTIAEASDPAWKHCTMPDVNKKNSLKCTKVPSDVQEEMIKLLSKKLDNKQRKNREKEEDRAEVDLSHSEGEERSDADGNSVIVLKKVTSKGAFSGGPMDKYYKLTPEEIVAARKGKPGVAEKVQSKLSTEKREEKRDSACKYIYQFFYEAGIPHNTVTLPSFDLMLEAIGDFGMNLRGPTPYEMSGKFLQKRKRKVQESLKSHQESWELNGCTVMTDAWTDKRGRGVMNLVVHSAYGVCFLDSVDCSAVKKNGRYIFELVDRCIKEIGVQNVVQVVTDNARPNEAATSLLKAKHPSIFWNGCAAHTIDLMLEDIGKMPRVATTISKAKCLTIFLYAHTIVLSLMRKFLSRDLVRCGVTRFATAYLNLKSLLENKKQLQRLFREDELNELGYLNSVKGKKANKVVRSETFWKRVETVVNYFEPLATVLRRMDSDVLAMGFLYGSLVEAKNEVSRRFNNGGNKFEEVFHIIDKRWDKENESFRDGVITCIMKLVPNEDTQDKIIEELQLFQDVEGYFGKEIAKRQCKKISILIQVHTKRRNRLLHDRTRDLVFVKFNSKLRKKDKDKDPIEKHVVDALEDEDNEWITGIEPTEVDLEQEGEETGASSQGVAAAPQGQEKRKGGNLQKHRDRKRKRSIPTIEDEELSASSSNGEDDNDMPSNDSSDSEAE
ncbi:uncharacterized protein [Miscanthus floridulus]|uniref:uncharacterized protein n=1 Tax=Miscanthus floridulus TaxID=154761 RepID=UPI003459D766